MDLLDLETRGSPYDYTFNFWNDYLGLSTLVAKSKVGGASRGASNSITASLKATLGLEDGSPVCSCAIRDADGGPSDCCCCCCCSCSCASPGSPPISIRALRERISLLRPYEHPEGVSRGGVALPGTLDLLSGPERVRRHAHQHQRVKPEPRVCVFCRNNGAPEEVYGTHILKTADGRVLCPILRAYTCPLCSASGDNAHTIKYCPLSRDQAGARAAAKPGRAAGKRLKIF